MNLAKKVTIRKTRKRYVVKGVRHRLKKAALKDVARRIGVTRKKSKAYKHHYRKHHRRRRSKTGQFKLATWY
jgi:hypothetical protein